MKKILSRLLIAPLMAVCLTSCAALGNGRQKVLVLAYQDFGPQVIAREVLGMEWWQWQEHGDSDPAVRDDIKVAVYKKIPLAEVKNKYPVEPEQKKDVRYLEYQNALNFLDEKITENLMEDVTDTLKKTRGKIVDSLGE